MPSTSDDLTSRVPPLEPSPDPHSTASSMPTPLGTLSTLPRELRDEIYGYVHDHVYYTSVSMYDGGKWRSLENKSSGLSMMKLSKAIRQEFLTVLYAQAVFVLEGFERFDGTAWEREKIPCIDQIMNVRYIASLGSTVHMLIYDLNSTIRNGHHAKFIPERSAKPIEFFAGTEVMRKSCSIELSFTTPWDMHILQSPFINATKALTGFKIITLKLESCDGKYWGDNTQRYKGISNADDAIGLRAVANAIRSTLEPSLGPGVIIEDPDKVVCLDNISLNITFHPRGNNCL